VVAAAPASRPISTVAAQADESAFARTVVEQRPEPESEPAPTIAPRQAAPAASPESASAPLRPATPERKKLPVAIFAGVGALAVAGIAAFMLVGKGAPDKPLSSASSPAASSSPEVPVAAPVALAGAAVAATPASAAASSARHASAAAAKTSAAHRSLVAAKPKPAASIAPVVEPPPRAPVVAVVPKREEARPAPVVAAGPSPVDACKDKFFLSREFCLAENCKKPGQRSHPLCVEWREDVKLRDAARSRNNLN
jgi:hypothetical protein